MSRRDAANRANAAKSTGPRTAKGKARSSRNAITHGLTAVRALIPGENPRELKALEESLLSQFADHPVAHVLCLQYAAVIWRLSRIRRLEAASMACSTYALFAYEQPLEDGEVYGRDQVFQDHTFESYHSISHSLGREAIRLAAELDCLSRYEAMLFAQLVKLSQMLEPYALERDLDEQQPNGESTGFRLVEGMRDSDGRPRRTNQSQH